MAENFGSCFSWSRTRRQKQKGHGKAKRLAIKKRAKALLTDAGALGNKTPTRCERMFLSAKAESGQRLAVAVSGVVEKGRLSLLKPAFRLFEGQSFQKAFSPRDRRWESLKTLVLEKPGLKSFSDFRKKISMRKSTLPSSISLFAFWSERSLVGFEKFLFLKFVRAGTSVLRPTRNRPRGAQNKIGPMPKAFGRKNKKRHWQGLGAFGANIRKRPKGRSGNNGGGALKKLLSLRSW
jgi:hypothetical protein